MPPAVSGTGPQGSGRGTGPAGAGALLRRFPHRGPVLSYCAGLRSWAAVRGVRCGAAERGLRCGSGAAERSGAAVRELRCGAERCGAERSGGCSAGSAVRGCGAELRCGAGLLGALPPCGLARPVAMGPAPPLRARHPPPSRSRRLAGRGRGLQGAPANLNSLLLFLSPKSGGRNCRRSAPAPAPGLSPLLCGARQRRRRR